MSLVFLALAWFSGMLLADQVLVPRILLGIAGLWACAVAVLERRRPSLSKGAVLVVIALLGCWRWQAGQPHALAGDMASHNDSGLICIEGYVSSDPIYRGTSQRFKFTAVALHQGGMRMATRGAALVSSPVYPTYKYGQRMRVCGEPRTPAILESFDYREYLASQGIGSTIRNPAIEPLEGTGGSPVLRILARVRGMLRVRVQQLLPQPEAGLFEGILLGLDDTLPEGLAEDFRIAGLTHIIVISGYNISILLQAWFAAAGRYIHRWAVLGSGLAVLLVFALLVGPSPPVVRAVLMSSMAVVAQLAGRRDWPLASLAFSAFLMTAANPLLMHSVSFQLSIAATLALIVLQPRLVGALALVLHTGAPDEPLPLPRVISEVMVSSLAAQLCTLPIIWAQFGQVSLLALLANLLVLPLQPFILIAGAGIVLLSLAAPAIGQPLAVLVWLPLRWTIIVVQWIGAVPWAAVTLPELPRLGAWLIYAALLLLAWRMPARQPVQSQPEPTNTWRTALPVLLPCTMVALLWMGVRALPDGRLHIYTLDVGQGDAILIRSPQGHLVLVDGGPDPLLLASRLGRVLPIWERSIDLVLVTHDDADHVGGLAGLPSHYRISQAVYVRPTAASPAGQAWQEALRVAGISPISLTAGSQVRLGECSLSVLHPAAMARETAEQGNDDSLVSLLEYGHFRLLMMGDAGIAVEQGLLARGELVQTTALKVAHHGSPSASSSAFLGTVSPQVALVSVGGENRYGHPAPTVLERLEQAGALVLRTDQRATIELSTDGARLWIKTDH